MSKRRSGERPNMAFIQIAILLARLSHMFTVAPPRALLASPSTSRLEVAWTCSSIWWAKLPLDGPGSLPAAAPHPRVTRPSSFPPYGVGHGSRPSSRRFSVVTKLSRHGLLSYLRPYYTLNSALSVGLYRNKAPSRLGTLRLRESNHAGGSILRVAARPRMGPVHRMHASYGTSKVKLLNANTTL